MSISRATQLVAGCLCGFALVFVAALAARAAKTSGNKLRGA
jgi:hypothetical protein